jgi:predicted RND superfamily exporter protein
VKDVTGRLARASSAHPGRTLVVWAVAVVLSLGAIGGLLGSTLTTDAEMTNDPESYRAYDLVQEHFPPSTDYVNELVVVRSRTLDVDSPAFRTKVEELAREIEETGVVQPVRTYYTTGDRSLVSPSKRATVIPLGVIGDGEEAVERVIELVDAAEDGEFETAITGEFTADRDFSTLSE